jgi:hypothetical protein
MCIKYHTEFWNPVANDKPGWERQVKGGAQPGQNVNARIVPFWECRGRFSREAVCSTSQCHHGGWYNWRILDFCYEDHDCAKRMVDFEEACDAARREAEAMEGEQRNPGVQAEATSRWRRAYDEWMSAYEHHRDCPSRRSGSQLFQDLRRAGVVRDKPRMSDAARLGIHPRSAPQPTVGMNRQYDGSGRRY